MAKRNRKSGNYVEGKSKLGISLTPTGINLLGQIAKEAGLSKSELLERVARGSIAIASDTANQTIAVESANEQSSPEPQRPKLKIELVAEEQPNNSTVPKDQKYESLQQEAQQQAEQIKELQNKLEQQLASTPPEDEEQLVQRQLEEKNTLIAQLKNQLTEQQSTYNQQAEDYQSLQKQFTQQQQMLAEVQQQLEQQTETEQKDESNQSLQQQAQNR